jgi:hypothetical protein
MFVGRQEGSPGRRAFLLSLLATCAMGPRVTAQPASPPAFEAFPYDVRPSDLAGEPELGALIADLLEAARRRDATLVEPWLSAKVYSLGEVDEEEPRKAHEPAPSPRDWAMGELREWDGPSWDRFAHMLRAGVRLDDERTSAVAPFTEDVNGADVTLLGERVQVHEQPDAASPVVATLGYATVTRSDLPDCRDGGEEWVCVASNAGTPGWISVDDVHEFFELRMHFSKTPDGWRVSAFGASC